MRADVRECHGARTLMERNSTERLVVIWSRENPPFLVHRLHGDKTSTPQASTNVVLCYFEGMVLNLVVEGIAYDRSIASVPQ